MNTVFSWPVLVVLGTGIGTLYLISYLLQYRHRPGAKWFIVTLSGQATFCFAYGLGLLVFDPTIRLWLELLALIGLAWLGVPFLGFALGYTGRGSLLDSWIFKILLVFPIATTCLLPLNAWYDIFLSEFEVSPTFGVATVTYSLEPILLFGVLGAGAVVSVASLMLFETVLSYGPLYRKEAAAVALSPVAPIVGMFPWLFGFGPAPAFNTIALGLLPHVILDTYAFRRSEMFDFYPATNRVAERSTIADLESPVIILEGDGRIVDCNSSAVRLIGQQADAVISRSIEDVLDLDFDTLQGATETELQYVDRGETGRQVYFIKASPLVDSGDRHVGYTLLFHDVTEAVQREERLAVLNRVLRHNLRNDLNAIEGFVDTATRRSQSDDVSHMLERAQDKTRELAETGEMARAIEQLIDQPVHLEESVHLEALVTKLAETYEADHPAAKIRFTGDQSVIVGDSAILERVLDELIENALIHSGGDPATVTISSVASGDRLELTVRDLGCGIPAHEIESLEKGNESALEHGSGLGLWLVKWAVLKLGGDLEFDADSNGTIVRIVLPHSVE